MTTETILSIPESAQFTDCQFGLKSNTRRFVSPLSGQTQTLEQAGARWQAQYTTPPMKRADVAAWQSFFMKLRGQAGCFYGYDANAKIPRGAAQVVTTASRNEIRNGDASGAILGVIGSGGSWPTYWNAVSANGLVREVVGKGVDAGIYYIDVRLSGTPTANYHALSFDTLTQIAASEGEVWTASYNYKLVGGSLSNIVSLGLRLDQAQSNGSILISPMQTLSAPNSDWQRGVYTRTISNTTPDTARLRAAQYLTLTIGQPIDITLRIGAAMLEKSATASLYIPTQTEARGRSSGACINGRGQSGTNLQTWNWQPSLTAQLCEGDYIAFDTPRGRALHMVMEVCGSDALGCMTIKIEPPLRTAPLDGTPVVLQKAGCLMSLQDESVSWQADAQGVYRLSFAAEERLS